MVNGIGFNNFEEAIKECKLLVKTNDSKNSLFFFNFGNLDNFLINFNFGYELIIISYKLILSY